MSRIATALVAVPLLLALLLKGPGWLFLALALVFALAGYWEIAAMADKIGWKLLPIGYPLVALLVTAFYPGFPGIEIVGLALIVLVGTAAVFSRRPGLATLGAVATTILAAVYVGPLLGSVVGLRMIEPDGSGRLWVIFLLAVVMVGDAGAFLVGRSLGKSPLAPSVSPNKTVEGFIGGSLFSVAAAGVLRVLAFPTLSWATVLGLGLSLALLGVAGDLFESLLKRSAGVKDTSSLLPGHGGVLDRIDSLLFAAPFLFLYVRWAQS